MQRLKVVTPPSEVEPHNTFIIITVFSLTFSSLKFAHLALSHYFNIYAQLSGGARRLKFGMKPLSIFQFFLYI